MHALCLRMQHMQLIPMHLPPHAGYNPALRAKATEAQFGHVHTFCCAVTPRHYATSAITDPSPERTLRSAASAIQVRMCARCVSRAAMTLAGSSGLLNMRSR